MHLAAALRDHARALRRDGRTLPPRLAELASGLLRSEPASSGRNSPRSAGSSQDQPSGLLVSAGEAARLLGVSSRTVSRRAASGALSSVRDGNRRRYERAALQRYIDALPSGRSAE
ncbi:helix-turn-helix domain-containing protein [Streptomyces sp. NPDC093223]|uniref:helix-turn-helix domain-containing protein n=1 Tax=Streptomyces sp. NPDC093223 TaxID=3366033 RepID=UPI00382D61AA